jgi:hypothetical protein
LGIDGNEPYKTDCGLEFARQLSANKLCCTEQMGHFMSDFSIVVKNRAPLPKALRWEIYRAGRGNPVEQSTIFFDTVVTANKAGKNALRHFLSGLSVQDKWPQRPHNETDAVGRWEDEGGRARADL